MKSTLLKKLSTTHLVAIIVSAGAANPSWADTPDIKTPSPVIFLSDNFNEPDNLGWCIDTLGRGFAEELQAHSCKPQGGDVQFDYQPQNKSITSVAFSDMCMTHNSKESTVVFGLVDCDSADPAQQFVFDRSTGYLTPHADTDLCVAVGETIRKAGPFSSRDLILANCNITPPIHITWTIRDTQ